MNMSVTNPLSGYGSFSNFDLGVDKTSPTSPLDADSDEDLFSGDDGSDFSDVGSDAGSDVSDASDLGDDDLSGASGDPTSAQDGTDGAQDGQTTAGDSLQQWMQMAMMLAMQAMALLQKLQSQQQQQDPSSTPEDSGSGDDGSGGGFPGATNGAQAAGPAAGGDDGIPQPTQSATAAPPVTAPSSGGQQADSFGDGAQGAGATNGAAAADPASGSDSGAGGVQGWVNDAASALAQQGIHMSDQDKQNMATIAQHESSGNPQAVNNWDYNAQAGHPSQGLFQMIPSTFDAYKSPGHDDINNPVDNAMAAYKYMQDRYGSTDNVPGIVSLNNGGQYVGY